MSSSLVSHRSLAALAATALLASSASDANAAVFAQYSSFDPTPGAFTWTGQLGSTAFTAANNYPENLPGGPALINSNFSSASIYAQPGGSSQGAVIFNLAPDSAGGYSTFFTYFDSEVSNLGVYMKFWRAGEWLLNARDVNGNEVGYSFLSGTYASAPAISWNSFTLSDNFTSGIIAFHGAVKELTWTNTAPSEGGNGIATFAILDPVPAPGAIALLGMAGLAKRRRR
jgi:hypothetical protein